MQILLYNDSVTFSVTFLTNSKKAKNVTVLQYDRLNDRII